MVVGFTGSSSGDRITKRPDNVVSEDKIILVESKKRLLGLLLLRIS